MNPYPVLAVIFLVVAPDLGVGSCESNSSVFREERLTVIYKQTKACSQYHLLKLNGESQ
jgi:hypothetical protein